MEKEFKDILLSIQAIDKSRNVITIPSKDIEFDYRTNNLSEDLIFLSASFKGTKGDKKNISKEVIRLRSEKEKEPTNKNKNKWKYF